MRKEKAELPLGIIWSYTWEIKVGQLKHCHSNKKIHFCGHLQHS